jgi:hypothetical protein
MFRGYLNGETMATQQGAHSGALFSCSSLGLCSASASRWVWHLPTGETVRADAGGCGHVCQRT